MTSRYFRVLPLVSLLGVSGAVYGHFYFRGFSIDSIGNLLRFRAPYQLEASRLLYPPMNRFFIETGKSFGFEDEGRLAISLNIICALAALAFLYLFLDRLYRNVGLAFLGTGLVAFSPSFWWYCELIEVHTLNLFALFLFCWCSVRAFQLGIDPERSPWGQTQVRVLALSGTLVSGLFYLLTHSSSVFWLAALALTGATSGRCWKALFRFRSEPPFTRGLLKGLAVMGSISIAGAWLIRDSILHYYHLRVGFLGSGLGGRGPLEMIAFTFQQCFGQSFLVSCFAVTGGILFLKGAAPAWIKKTLVIGAAIHFAFLYFWVPNQGAFFLPLYSLLVALTLLAVREMFRGFSFGIPDAFRGALGATTFFVFWWTFRSHPNLPSVLLYLALSVGLAFSLTRYELVPTGRDGKRFVFACLVGAAVLFIQIRNTLPGIQYHYLDTSSIDQAKVLDRLSGPRTLIVATYLAQYASYFTESQAMTLGKPDLKRPTRTGQPYDEFVTSRIRRALQRGRPVLMSGESKKFLDKNSEFFPILLRFFKKRVRFQPVEGHFRLTLVSHKPQNTSLSPGPKDDRP